MVSLLPVHLRDRVPMYISIYTHTNTYFIYIHSNIHFYFPIYPSSYFKKQKFTIISWRSNPTPQSSFSFSPFQYFQLLSPLIYLCAQFFCIQWLSHHQHCYPFPYKNALLTLTILKNSHVSAFSILLKPSHSTPTYPLGMSSSNFWLSHPTQSNASVKKSLVTMLRHWYPCWTAVLQTPLLPHSSSSIPLWATATFPAQVTIMKRVTVIADHNHRT